MHLLRSTIQFLAAASLLLAAVQIYLTLNKLWKRKHEPAVADSISIMGEFVGLLPLLFLTMNFTLQGQWEGTVDGVLWLGAGGVSIAIGTGMWVEGRRGKGFFTLLREALALERGEVGDLANRFFHPAGARSILQILAHVALIDDHLDERERNFIQSFVDAWGIDFSPEAFRRGHPGDHLNYRALRSDVEAYLSTSPPPAQVQQLSDVVNALINVDEEVSEEEALVLGELLLVRHRIEGNAEYDGVGAFERLFLLTEPVALNRSARGRGLGIPPHRDPLPGKALQGDGVAILVLGRELGRVAADCQHALLSSFDCYACYA